MTVILRIGSNNYELDGAGALSVTTSNATNTVTVRAEGAGSIALTVNGQARDNGSGVTWQAGENTLLIDVDGTEYTVTVVKE